MSLNWLWTDRMGDITFTDGYTANLYQGNAFMMAVGETDTEYFLKWFAADEAHFKNMLGLTKGYEDEDFTKYEIAKMRLNLRYKSVPKIVHLLAKAKVPITIELFKE